MAASYPTNVKTFPVWVNGDDIDPPNQNEPNDEITAMESALLGGFEHNLNAPGFRFDDADALTIASGVVTITQGYNLIDTEGAAVADDLVTITIGVMPSGVAIGEGSLCLIGPVSTSRVVTVKASGGNIVLSNGDYVMSTTGARLLLCYDGTNWQEVARGATPAASWTPTLTPGTSGSITIDSGATFCKVVKLGRSVVLTGEITVLSVSAPVGRLTLGGLPYAQLAGARPCGTVLMLGTNAYTGYPLAFGDSSSSIFIDRAKTDGSDPAADLASACKAGTVLYFSFPYLTAS